MTNNNPLDPSYWEALGITPIIINSKDDKSVDDGFKELSDTIKEIVQGEKKEVKEKE